MTPRQRQAWTALGHGPRWVPRASTGRVGTAPVPQSQPLAVEAAPRDDASSAVAAMDWAALQAAVADCQRCGLCRSRQRTVFGVGPTTSRWMIVGEAPGAEEDARGEPFVGQAGRLLDAMLASLGLSRQRDVYITNVLKCRPPGNRNPEPDEVRQCEPFLQRQVELLAPTGILVMGRFAAQALLGTEASIASLRGRVHACRIGGRAVPAVVTYHPAYLLRNLPDKAKAWADLCLARASFAAGPPG